MRSQNTCRLKYALSAMLGVVVLAVGIGWSGPGFGADPLATLRKSEINQLPAPPRLTNPSTRDLRIIRNYPEQPPIIPHSIRNYQLDLTGNKCLTCHSRQAVGESQAPMVSVTHFANREGQVGASVSPRRYFCTQCHVTQIETRPLIGNTFVDMDHIAKTPAGNKGN